MHNYIGVFQSDDTKFKITKLLPCCCLRGNYPLGNLWLRLSSQTNVTQINLPWNLWYWCSNIFLYMDLNVSSAIWLNQLKPFLLKTSTAQGEKKKKFSLQGWGRTFVLHFKMFALFQEDIRISWLTTGKIFLAEKEARGDSYADKILTIRLFVSPCLF